jgi:hypothetical protein
VTTGVSAERRTRLRSARSALSRGAMAARVSDAVTRAALNPNGSVVGRSVGRAVAVPRHAVPLYWYRRKVLAVGSVLHHVAQKDVVWGAGVLRAGTIELPNDARVLAVRGPLSRGMIRGDVPEVYGDPAILVPLIFTPQESKRFRVGVVPHYRDRGVFAYADPAIAEIDVTTDWRDIVTAIVQCETVLSSSLHGLIVAEAYGVPAVWVRLSDRVARQDIKFDDYYLATNRDPVRPIRIEAGRLAAAVNSANSPPILDPSPLIDAWVSDQETAK